MHLNLKRKYSEKVNPFRFVNFFVLGLIASVFCIGCQKPNPATCMAIQTAASTGSEVGVKDPTYGSGALAQSFKVTTNTLIDTVQLQLSVIGTIAANQTITLTIQADANGSPSATVLATGSFPTSNIKTGAAVFYPISISSTALLAGTSYWLVLTGSYTASSANQIRWSSSNGSADIYTNGSAYYQATSTTWSQALFGALRDFAFKIGSCT